MIYKGATLVTADNVTIIRTREELLNTSSNTGSKPSNVVNHPEIINNNHTLKKSENPTIAKDSNSKVNQSLNSPVPAIFLMASSLTR